MAQNSLCGTFMPSILRGEKRKSDPSYMWVLKTECRLNLVFKISGFVSRASSGQERGAVDAAEAEVTFGLKVHEFWSADGKGERLSCSSHCKV